MAASIQEFANKFGRHLDELYQNWLCTFDALLMHFSFLCIYFTNSAKIHKKIREIFWIRKIAKLAKVLALET